MAWRIALREAFRDPHSLCSHLGLPASIADQAASETGFDLLAPRPFVDRMRPGDAGDPLLRQVLPVLAEGVSGPLPTDAVGDLAATRVSGLIHKYRGRALLMAASQCAVNCRYCFRRSYPYDTLPRGDVAWEPALRAIEQDASIHEVILSGGDPLVLSDGRLERLLARLDRVPHVRRVRVHTRLPIVIPARVTERLVSALQQSRLAAVVVLHTNHSNEIDNPVSQAIDTLRSSGAILLNQSVLLRGVNDSVEALQGLSERLLDVGVTPYYLHQLDLVQGVSHFEVPMDRGRELVSELRNRLPGYAVPRYVRETPGQPTKTPLA